MGDGRDGSDPFGEHGPRILARSQSFVSQEIERHYPSLMVLAFAGIQLNPAARADSQVQLLLAPTYA
jgi:hypothetical protein